MDFLKNVYRLLGIAAEYALVNLQIIYGSALMYERSQFIRIKQFRFALPMFS